MLNMQSKITICINGKLIDFTKPKVMGILNVTPDSFYKESRTFDKDAIAKRADQIIEEGGDIIDIGAYSSRPGANEVSTQEEIDRLCRALDIIKSKFPDVILSIDTFRSSVAKHCISQYGHAIINDISGGEMDSNMFQTISELKVPYILMHMQGTPQTMQINPQYTNVTQNILSYFAKKIAMLHQLNVSDIIIDPGFGFGKTLENNYQLMKDLKKFTLIDIPLLVGISRKSMIYKALDTDPQHALNGTTVLNTYALSQGANILRVHDVREAAEAVRIMQKITGTF